MIEYFLYHTDIDECSDGTHSCDPDAKCDNTDGSYQCTCNKGYSGDGTFCDGNYYFHWYDIVSHSDINIKIFD